MTKYFLITIGVLFCGCVVLYNLWDDTKIELANIKEQKITLEQELKRRDENERNLSKRINELTRLYNANSDWAASNVPSELSVFLSKSCKACK